LWTEKERIPFENWKLVFKRDEEILFVHLYIFLKYICVSVCWCSIALINRPIEFIGPESLIIRRNESKWLLEEEQNRRNQHPLIQLDRNPISKDNSLSTNSIHTKTHTLAHTLVTSIIYSTNHKFCCSFKNSFNLIGLPMDLYTDDYNVVITHSDN